MGNEVDFSNKDTGSRPYSKDLYMLLPGKLTGIAAVLLISLFIFSESPRADEYIIGADDVLKISFWQQPEMDQTVRVRQDGKITLSIIGEITAAGITSQELSETIQRNVSLYHKDISQATVTVIGFNSQKIFLTGQISEPGRRSYEVIPDLWTVIKEAGGATEMGDLTRVTIIRSEEHGGERITVNLLEVIATGQTDRLPQLKVGDTIEIPKMAGGVPGRQLTADYSERRNLYYVYGQVRAPGTMAYEEGIDIFDAIGAAGGTTERANLKDVVIITKTGAGSTSLKLNLQEYQTQGKARRLAIKPEDTVIIGEKRRRLLSWQVIRDLAVLASTILAFIYIFDAVGD
jgi:polysaccharide export outer membrane protein